MNGISHKQAIQWIHRRLDGLLNESQLLLLDEHLGSCVSCRVYSAEMDLLPVRLRNEFHVRWDNKPVPSQKVIEQVTAKARNIPIINRISSSVKLFAGVAALVLLVFLVNFVVSQLQNASISATETGPINGVASTPSLQVENRLIAFTSEQNGNFDIFTMHADGSGLTNLTNSPAYDSNPFWSPDGKRIAFVSGHAGSFGQIYLMDADGSDVVQLTHDQANHEFSRNYGASSGPWSPDGSRLIFSLWLPGEEKWTLYTMDINGENKTPLVNETNIYSSISWSPDGKHIAFVADDPQNLGGDRLYVVNADGSNRREITKSLQQNQELSNPDYYWSPDGQSIFFIAFFQQPDPYWTAYEVSLDDNSLIEHATISTPIDDWRNGITLITDFSGRSPFKWLRSDGTTSTLYPYEKCQQTDASKSGSYIKRSSNGNLLINAYCPNGDSWFYWANSDGTVTKQLLDSPISTKDSILSGISWSPDDKFIALNIASSDKSDMYILNVSELLKDPSIQPLKMANSFGPAWQPISNENITKEIPTPKPTQDLASDGVIAFTSDQNGNSDIYTMRANGSEITNITSDSANDYSPLWSPDGQRIVFISERTGNPDIFSMDPDGSNLRQLTDNPGYDGYFSWSPDGQKIIYLTSSGNDPNTNSYQLIVMNADGSNKTALTEEPGSYIFLGWSLSGQKIVYQKQNSENIQNNEIHVIDINGTNHYQWRAIIDEIKWTDEGHFIGHGWSGISEPPSWKIYKFDANGSDPIEIAIYPSRIVALFNQTYLVEGIRTLAWYSPDGTTSPLKSWDFGTHCTKQGDLFLQETGHTISPDKTRAFVNVHCFDDVTWFYLENTDGSQFVQLTDFSVVGPVIESANWSPDGKYVTMTIASRDGGTADIYLFDIQKMLNDPSTQPVQLTTDGAMKYGAVWQPNP